MTRDLESSRVLVSGATGFVGSHLARRLVELGCRVHILCRPQSNFWRLEPILPRLDRHLAPLEDRGRLDEVVHAVRPEYVFHLAAATVVAGRAAEPAELHAVNVLGTMNLIGACSAVDYRALIATGDSFEYTAGSAPLSESAECRPDTPHGTTKLAATNYARAAASQGRPIVVLRLFSTYGPADNPKRLVPRVIEGALAGTPISLSRRDIVRDWVYVDDIVNLYLEAARKADRVDGLVFNAGSGIPVSLGEIVDAILRLTASNAEARWGEFPAPEHDAHPWVADMRRTFDQFEWRPGTSLDEGLRATIRALGVAAGRPIR